MRQQGRSFRRACYANVMPSIYQGYVMPEIEIINKEIDETINNVTHQHQQIKYYFQVYMVALVGLFSISGYFAKGGFSTHESIVGAAFTVTVFFLGWVFLSVVSHKVAMIILLYKHLSVFRRRRLNIMNCSGLEKEYVLPHEKKNVIMPGMLKFLPYLVFVFNFLILCGGLAFYLAPHVSYVQSVATISAVAVVLGAFYPRVCITFNKHISCAIRGATLRAKHRMENAWEKSVKQCGKPSRLIKVVFVLFSITGALGLAISSYYITDPLYQKVIVIACWIGVVVFAVVRYFIEIYNFKIAKNKVSEMA